LPSGSFADGVYAGVDEGLGSFFKIFLDNDFSCGRVATRDQHVRLNYF